MAWVRALDENKSVLIDGLRFGGGYTCEACESVGLGACDLELCVFLFLLLVWSLCQHFSVSVRFQL